MQSHCEGGFFHEGHYLYAAVRVAVLLICAAELPPTALPARQSAWWSLICPGMLGKPDGTERVTFVWPALTWLRGIFLVNS